MKKTMALAIVLCVFLTSLTGCSKTNTETSPNSSTNSSSSASETTSATTPNAATTTDNSATSSENSSSDSSSSAFKSYTSVSYVKNGTSQQTMDIYVPETKDAKPLFVMIHGGAFTMGSSTMEQVQDMYNYFRTKGYVCASLNYTLGQGTYPQGVIDTKTAIQYLVDNASTYNIDTSKIIVWGESAGSYIGALASLSGANDFKSNSNDAAYTFEADVYVDFYGPICPKDYPDMAASNWLGSEAPIDLSTYLSSTTVKNIWIQHGDSDSRVSYENAKKFNSDASATIKNLYYELLPGADHMDPAFYTDSNLEKLNNFLIKSLNIK